MGDLISAFTKASVDGMFSNIYGLFSAFTDLCLGSSVVEDMFKITLPIGLVLTLIYFLIDLEDVAMRQNFSVEYFVRNLTKIVVAYAILSNIGSIFVGIENFIDELMTEMPLFEGLGIPQVVLEDAGGVANRIAFGSTAVRPSVSDVLGYAPDAILISLINAFLLFITYVVAVKRAFELTVWYVLAPIIFADSYSKKFYGVANKLKRLFAVYMQAPFIIVILGFGQLMLAQTQMYAPATSTRIFFTLVIAGAVMKQIAGSKADIERIFAS